MTRPPVRSPRSAGVLLAIFPLSGAVIGGLMGQPSAGLVAGIAAGIVVAVAFWLVDRRR